MPSIPEGATPTLAELLQQRKPLRNINQENDDNLSSLDQAAVWITNRIGTMGFFLLILIWTVLWLGWNFLAPLPWRFDPATGFVLWLFISNVIQILLMPLIMVGQNVIGRHAELRAEHDLEINVRAEEEIAVMLVHLERQNLMMLAMIEKLDIKFNQIMPSQNIEN
ncbi:DUF1003 domain-containing protein [Polynucleobacter antarcticus]|uniref:DUF1003 domain-containing protein n=1 Tax=Polynucleobacter antarcticus TaxID=1743162 RepID=A0A6M9PP27_9BURK|nr:DUF1003 domain-containing protein [Polynucleobacter antarcticus]QKM62161.1 DUF1003 domain-containing protein [Polynucleobacter antarcticus]